QLLDFDRLGDAKLVVGGLQGTVVKQRDLHGLFSRQGPLEQALHFNAHGSRFTFAADRCYFFVEVSSDYRGGQRQAVRRKCLATRKQHRAGEGSNAVAERWTVSHGPSFFGLSLPPWSRHAAGSLGRMLLNSPMAER